MHELSLPNRRLFLAGAASFIAAPAIVRAQSMRGFPPGTFQSRAPLDGGVTTTNWNPSDIGANLTLSNGNLTATGGTTTGYPGVRAVANHSSGKYYYEAHCDLSLSGSQQCGVGNGSAALNNYMGSTTTTSCGVIPSGSVLGGAGGTATAFTTGDTICVALDVGNNNIWFRKGSGIWNNNAGNDPAANTGGISVSTISGPFYPMCTTHAVGDAWTANFGATAYSQTPPSGFGNW